jgi:hypothetical protein
MVNFDAAGMLPECSVHFKRCLWDCSGENKRNIKCRNDNEGNQEINESKA